MDIKLFKNRIRAILPRYVINRGNMICDIFRIHEVLKSPSLPYKQGVRPEGINLYGDFELGTGLSRSVNLLKRDLELAGIEYSMHQVEEFSGIPLKGDNGTDYAINVFHLQPPILPRLFDRIPDECRDGHYNIAHWVWETPEVPKEWIPLCNAIDEIWTPSVFSAKAFRRITDKPIRVYPHGVYEDKDKVVVNKEEVRQRFGIEKDSFVALVMYDGMSGAERKNPAAAIRAFKKAFPNGSEKVTLLIKAKSLDKKDKKQLEELLGNETRVVRIEKKLSYEETQELFECSNVLLSLHRAEGFGLPVAEMMEVGGVALSTDYSGTKDFVNEHNACPVSFKLVRTNKDYSIYRRGAVWAEPDEDDAAEKLRQLYENPELCNSLGEAAKKTIKEILSAESIGKRIHIRVNKICSMK